MRIGSAIRVVRKLKGMTQLKLAEKTGIPNSSLSLIETNYRKTSWEMIERVCVGLEIRPIVLLALTEIDTNKEGE